MSIRSLRVLRVMELAAEGARRLGKLLMGRRFVLALERNREAADRLDALLQEMLRR